MNINKKDVAVIIFGTGVIISAVVYCMEMM